MNTSTKDRANTSQQIEAQENELKELLSRVIKSPLQPLETQLAQLEKRLQNVEAISKSTSEVNLPAVQAAIREQSEDARKNFRVLRAAITDELPELLTACLTSMPQELTRLLEGQTTVKDILGEVQKEQTLQGRLAGDAVLQSEALLLKSFAQMNEISSLAKAAVQAAETAVVEIDASRELIGKNIGNMQADGRLGMKQLDNGMTALAGSLNQTNAQVKDLVPTLAGQTDELGSRLESGFASFRKQSEESRSEMSSALQVMQRRIVWLSALSVLSFSGSVGLVVSRFTF